MTETQGKDIRVECTYREHGRPQRLQTYNANGIEMAVAIRRRESAKPSCVRVTMLVAVETWSRIDQLPTA